MYATSCSHIRRHSALIIASIATAAAIKAGAMQAKRSAGMRARKSKQETRMRQGQIAVARGGLKVLLAAASH